MSETPDILPAELTVAEAKESAAKAEKEKAEVDQPGVLAELIRLAKSAKQELNQ